MVSGIHQTRWRQLVIGGELLAVRIRVNVGKSRLAVPLSDIVRRYGTATLQKYHRVPSEDPSPPITAWLPDSEGKGGRYPFGPKGHCWLEYRLVPVGDSVVLRIWTKPLSLQVTEHSQVDRIIKEHMKIAN